MVQSKSLMIIVHNILKYNSYTFSPTVTSCVRSAWTPDLSSTGPSQRHVLLLLLAAVSSLLLSIILICYSMCFLCEWEKLDCFLVVFMKGFKKKRGKKVNRTILDLNCRNPNPNTEIWKKALRRWTPYCWLWCEFVSRLLFVKYLPGFMHV